MGDVIACIIMIATLIGIIFLFCYRPSDYDIGSGHRGE
jgi:hypothetical protein